MKIKWITATSVVLLLFFLSPSNVYVARADELSDSVKDRVNALELGGLEEEFNNSKSGDFDFFTTLNNLLEGKYDGEENVFEYIKDILFSSIGGFMPTIIGIILVALLCELVGHIKSKYLSDSVISIVKFVAVLTVILLVLPSLFSIWGNTKNLIENIGKISEIMSPIIITLMVASGGVQSAAIYKPSVVFFTSIVINVFYSLVLPLIGVLTAFNIMSHFSKEVRVKRFADFFGGVLKWIFGIIVVVYGILISTQGIIASATDGISAKVAKYAISNSVPIVGGLIKDGVDVVTAGSLVVKNALGIAGVFGLFYIILSPVIEMAVFSLLLKFAAAVTDIFAGDIVSEFLETISKTINYLIASVLTVGLMAFLTVLLMVLSANSVI